MANKLQELVKEVKRLEKKMKKDGQDALHGAFREFFEAHPEASAVVWTQYTPWFNDGDACVFHTHEMELKLHEQPRSALDEAEEQEADDEYDLTDTEYQYGDGCAANFLGGLEDNAQNRRYNKDGKFRALTPQEKSLVEDFNELASSCGEIEEVMKMTFGDHVKVIATKDGFDIDEYEHD